MDNDKNTPESNEGRTNVVKENYLISVIVPVYNVERYLKKCINSIRDQSYINLEIILVDDGSDDASGRICDEFAEIDPRIFVIHKKNGGLSSARNAGLDVAQGQYISLIDGDDYIHFQMYERMLALLINEKADMISCGFQMVEEDEKLVFFPIQQEAVSKYICVTGREILHQLWIRDNETVVQWNKLFRRELFNGCRYPKGKYHEDVYVIHQILDKCKKIIYLNEKLYYYVQRQKSIMHSESKQAVLDAIEGYEERIVYFKEHDLVYECSKTIRVLFDYLKWKYNMMKEQNAEIEREWLVEVYQEKYIKYEGKLQHSREERILFRFPQYFDNYVKWRNFIFKICSNLSGGREE